MLLQLLRAARCAANGTGFKVKACTQDRREGTPGQQLAISSRQQPLRAKLQAPTHLHWCHFVLPQPDWQLVISCVGIKNERAI